MPPVLGKWSAAEIVSHLADCEIVFAFRLRQTLAEDNPTIQPFDQDKWAAQSGCYESLNEPLKSWENALVVSEGIFHGLHSR